MPWSTRTITISITEKMLPLQSTAMPRGFLRLLAVLLLVLAIPVQGIAALAKAQCMSFGHHQYAGHHEHQGHAHDSTGGDGHTKAPAQPHCGPCAACCAAAVAAAPAARMMFDAISTPPCCTPSKLASISLDTPERPPLVG
jgi:hypothetical protein